MGYPHDEIRVETRIFKESDAFSAAQGSQQKKLLTLQCCITISTKLYDVVYKLFLAIVQCGRHCPNATALLNQQRLIQVTVEINSRQIRAEPFVDMIALFNYRSD